MTQPLFTDDPEQQRMILENLAKISAENRGNTYAQLAVANAMALVLGEKPEHDLEAYVETGNSRPGWFYRLRKRLGLVR